MNKGSWYWYDIRLHSKKEFSFIFRFAIGRFKMKDGTNDESSLTEYEKSISNSRAESVSTIATLSHSSKYLIEYFVPF